MSVTKKDVEHIAKLAKLEIREGEINEFTSQLNKVLEYVDKLNELDTENVEPLSHPVEGDNVFNNATCENVCECNFPTELKVRLEVINETL